VTTSPSGTGVLSERLVGDAKTNLRFIGAEYHGETAMSLYVISHYH